MDNFIYGFHSINAYLEQDASNIEIIYVDDNRKDKRINNLGEKAKSNQIIIKHIKSDVLAKLCNAAQHQGVVAKVTRLLNQTYSLDELINSITHKKNAIILILDGITDPHNLGAIIRTSDCFGVDGIILPQNNSANPNNATVIKSSSGATQYIPIVIVNNLSRTIHTLKQHDFWIAGTSLAKDSISLTDFKHDGKIAWVMGNEGNGLRRLVAENCDYLVTIPMYGKTQSLNVSVATGVILTYTKLLH